MKSISKSIERENILKRNVKKQLEKCAGNSQLNQKLKKVFHLPISQKNNLLLIAQNGKKEKIKNVVSGSNLFFAQYCKKNSRNQRQNSAIINTSKRSYL